MDPHFCIDPYFCVAAVTGTAVALLLILGHTAAQLAVAGLRVNSPRTRCPQGLSKQMASS